MDEAAGLAPAALTRMLALGISGTQPFRDMIDALPVAIYTTDAHGKLTHFNPACIALSGRTPLLRSDHWCVTWKLYHPDGTPMPHDQCPMATALRERRPIRGQEAIAERPDGSRIWFEPYPTPLFDEAGELVGGINMLVDITGRKQAEEALRRSEACLSGQKEAFQMAMNGRPLAASLQALVNTAVAQIQGEARAAFYMAGAGASVLHHVTGMTEDYARQVDGFRIGPGSVGSGLAMHLREPVITPDVEADPAWRPWRGLAREHGYRACWSFPVQTSDGSIVGALAMYFAEPRHPSVSDLDLAGTLAQAAAVIISRHTQAMERAQAEEALSTELQASAILHDVSAEFIREGSEQEMYERILDAAVAIMHSDFASMQMLHPERGAGGELRLLGHRGFSEAAARLWEWMPAGSGTTCGGALSVGTRQIASDVEQSGLSADSEHLAMFRTLGIRATQTTPLVSRGGKLLGMISTHWKVPHMPSQRDLRLLDILARQAADFIERTQGALAMRDADRRKDEFLATLAHELRNPLAPIRYAAVLARRSESTTAQREEAVSVIERQAAHMARLLDDLLDISRITRGSLELRKGRVELAGVVTAAVEAARPLLEDRHHTMTVSLPDAPVRFDADAVRVTQILSNLLTNAAKYTDPHGQIELCAREQDGDIVLTVRDNGIGISSEMLPKIFLIFSQAKPALERADGGLGIGLALVRGLVQLHGGSVEAHSAGPNRGSEFVVRLPRGAEARQEGSSIQRPAATSAAPQLRVLIADDNRDGADICCALLGAMGHEVQTAYCGRTALETAGRMRPHVALLDIGMPELNGYEVATRIRAEPWGRRIVLAAVTGWGQQSDRERALAAGFDHHITKPMDPEQLESVFDSVRKIGMG